MRVVITAALALLAVASTSASAASSYETITLANGLTLTGDYDEAAGTIVVEVPRSIVAARKPAVDRRAKPAAAVAAGTTTGTGPIAGDPFGPVHGRRSKLGDNTVGRDQTYDDNAVGDGKGPGK
ncbi:MAG TPA: hypothetical protein VD838_14440 [Anaeromyxobacteraceae bacterium]|nr:hypothetical protein [Anaeromyxobacteraceae bacterium]